ncbi:MAG: alpha-hydroxy-acid oxidizing protein [Myxococcales bacterium]|nr:alpha-hydroxy-acid oxidizing protein [Myxococcales bacterium]
MVSGVSDRPINLLEYEAAARARLAGPAFDYYVSGAHDELTLRDNRAAYERLRLAYRVLVDVAERDASTTVLGAPLRFPVMVAPTAFHRMAHEDGELATVRAAGEAGTIMILSSLSTTAVEEVVAAASGPVWFQLYVYRDRAATEGLVRRAEAAGCQAIVLTVDAPVLGTRERDVRNRFHLPPGLHVANLLPAGYGAVDQPAAESGLSAYFAGLIDPRLSWDDLAWLRELSSLPLLLKGVVRADDAARAVEHGVAGIVVSNHGGRQLDTSVATLDALPGIVEAVAGRAEVLLDGGIRRGTDVLKALALGARAVCVGRPVLWGLAVDGQAGVAQVLGLLHDELDLAMALCGAPTLASITPDLLVRPG